MSDQQFTIQPHPATTNDPTDTAKLGGAPTREQAKLADAVGAMQAPPGAAIPSAQVAQGLEKPKTKEQIAEEFKKLNG